jgi:hypothetical protein
VFEVQLTWQTLFVQLLLEPFAVSEHDPQERALPHPSLTTPQFFPSDAQVTFPHGSVWPIEVSVLEGAWELHA